MDSLVRSVLGETMEDARIKTVVCFKSEHAFFLKERSGVKPNTQREIDATDARFAKLQAGDATLIEVKDKQTGETIIREITDISIYEGWMTISWHHPR